MSFKCCICSNIFEKKDFMKGRKYSIALFKAHAQTQILTPFSQRQNIESCAFRTYNLFEFKEALNLPKA